MRRHRWHVATCLFLIGHINNNFAFEQRKGFIAYERTLSSIQHQNLIPIVCVCFIPYDLDKTCLGLLKLILVSSQLKIITFSLHTISRLLDWMSVRYTIISSLHCKLLCMGTYCLLDFL